MLAYAALLTTLLVGGFAWTTAQISALDAQIGTLDTKTASLISALDAKIGTLDTKIDAERLARLEVLIMERLPHQQ